MSKKYIFGLLAATAAGLCSCSQDNPFPEEMEGEGYLNRDAMAVEFKNAERLVRSGEGVDVGDFTVQIRRKSDADEGELVKQYAYSEMPEIVALQPGDYTVKAIYGENPDAAWEAPYYLGNSDFRIEKGKIADDLAPVVCKLSNIRITINFGDDLAAKMGPDAKVNVKVGQTGSLDFTKDHVGKSGYFAYMPGSQSITATFSGTIDGNFISETKAYDNAAGGNHYKVSFAMHDASSEEPGDLTGNIIVDATVTEQDMTEDILPEDQYQKDDMRPVEGDPEEPDTPVTPVDPSGPAPTITAEAPIDLTRMNELSDDSSCVLHITSVAEGGIKAFTVDIDSDTLTPDELEGVGIGAHLDMVNPGEFEDGLGPDGLNFPIHVGGDKEVTFDITGFLPMLNALGEGTHKFTLSVTDANGTTTAVLRLHSN